MSEYSGLRFERSRTAPRRLIFVGSTLLAFNLLWWRVPQITLYWVLLAGFMILAWLASYGWRQALTVFHNLIHRLEQF